MRDAVRSGSLLAGRNSGQWRTPCAVIRTADVDTLPMQSRKYTCLAFGGNCAGISCTYYRICHDKCGTGAPSYTWCSRTTNHTLVSIACFPSAGREQSCRSPGRRPGRTSRAWWRSHASTRSRPAWRPRAPAASQLHQRQGKHANADKLHSSMLSLCQIVMPAAA